MAKRVYPQEQEASVPRCFTSVREVTELVTPHREQEENDVPRALSFRSICKNKSNLQCKIKVVGIFFYFNQADIYQNILGVSSGNKTH